MVAWTSYGLDMKDYMIFLRIEQNPSESNAAIAKEVGLSAESVRIRRHNIKEQGFLRPDKIIKDPLFGERLQTEVESVYSPYNLGLTRQHVLFKDIPDRTALNKLKLLCDEHPYTHYRAVAYGKNATLYVQYDIPSSIISTMNTLYSELSEYGLFKECLVVVGRFVTRNKADFNKWDVDSKEWELELERKSGRGLKTSRVEKVWGKILKQPVDDKLKVSNPTMACTLDMLDMHLLRELTINAHPKIKELGGVYDKDPTTISRRIAKLRECVAPSEMLYFDRTVFDLTYPQLIFGEFEEDSDLDYKTLHKLLCSGGLPFECMAATNKNKFLVFMTSPPSFAPEVSEFFWENALNIDVFQLQLDSAFTYFFYHENFDTSIGWKTDEDYVLNIPLATLNK